MKVACKLMKFLLLSLVIIGTSCTNSIDDGHPSSISFDETIQIFYESDNEGVITATIDKPQFAYIQGDLTVRTSSSTTEFDDFYITDSPMVINGGDIQGIKKVSIYDDVVADGDDTVTLEFNKLVGNVEVAQTSNKSTSIIIKDDDNIPENEMHLHLNWMDDSGYSLIPQKDYNLSLTVITNVVLKENGSLNEFDTYLKSDETDRFEHIVLNDEIPDSDYYILIRYLNAALNVHTKQISGVLKISGFGYTDRGQNLWSFSLINSNYYVIAGPFKKSGRSFVLVE